MALNGTMVKIETVTVGSGGAASIEFTNIPQTYTDLMILYSSRSAGNVTGSWSCKWSFNGATTSYTTRGIFGDGSAASTSTTSDTYGGYHNNSTSTASTFGNGRIYITNYTDGNNKSYSIDAVAENNATGGYASLLAGLRSNTAAITSVKLEDYNGNNLAQYSSATLYGISKVPSIAKAYGGEISFDSNYVYHVFPSSGTFTPLQNLTVDFLVVAGGGGGGGQYGGGGGAGGYRTSVGTSGRNSSAETPLSLTASTNYTVTVGAGGNGGSDGNVDGSQGSNSVFSTVTSTGGGRGGTTNSTAGSGGAGGGPGVPDSDRTIAGGGGTANQGFDSGSSIRSGGGANLFAGAGGGGAGAAGASNSGRTGGDGGTGIASSITGTSVTRAGGGGGAGGFDGSGTKGTGGSGGGGDGAQNNTTVAQSGTVNTGGGGGGGMYTTGTATQKSGGAGGSGIVIVRYAK
jgi:hypothetical protein